MKKLTKHEQSLLIILLILSFLAIPYFASHSEIIFTITLLVALVSSIIFIGSENESDATPFSFIAMMLTLPAVAFTIATIFINTHNEILDSTVLKSPAIVNEQICGITKRDTVRCVDVADYLSSEAKYLIQTNQVKELNITRLMEHSMYGIPIGLEYRFEIQPKVIK